MMGRQILESESFRFCQSLQFHWSGHHRWKQQGSVEPVDQLGKGKKQTRLTIQKQLGLGSFSLFKFMYGT